MAERIYMVMCAYKIARAIIRLKIVNARNVLTIVMNVKVITLGN